MTLLQGNLQQDSLGLRTRVYYTSTLLKFQESSHKLPNSTSTYVPQWCINHVDKFGDWRGWVGERFSNSKGMLLVSLRPLRLARAMQENPKVGPWHRVPNMYLDMVVGIKQDVCRLEVQVEQWRGHAVQEIHPHSCLVDDAEAQFPG